ncbi:MAG: hypothetical protein IT365_00430 [Candidatus Hydrogenedentes bacterium]|nr:hypothetical protein [Candidatus Hydrogenedentota bacterium]
MSKMIRTDRVATALPKSLAGIPFRQLLADVGNPDLLDNLIENETTDETPYYHAAESTHQVATGNKPTKQSACATT